MSWYLPLTLAVVLAGCATTAVPTDEATPAKQVLAPELLQPSAGAGAILIKRDTGAVGVVCAIRISVNSRPVADLWTGEKVVLHLAPGGYIVRAASTGICGGGDAETPVTIEPGRQAVWRVGIDTGMAIRIGPTSQ